MFRTQKSLLVNNLFQVTVDQRRKLYRKPQLQKLGDLRTLTLGGSYGALDSGSNHATKPFSPIPQPGDFPIFNPDGTIRNPDDPITTP